MWKCLYVYVCNMWMMPVCGCISACTYKYICVFDHACVNVYALYVCVCRCMFIRVPICKYVNI